MSNYYSSNHYYLDRFQDYFREYTYEYGYNKMHHARFQDPYSQHNSGILLAPGESIGMSYIFKNYDAYKDEYVFGRFYCDVSAFSDLTTGDSSSDSGLCIYS